MAAAADGRFWVVRRRPPLPPSDSYLHKEAAILSCDLKGKKWAVKTEGKDR